jgi:hypothetical protein
MVSLSNHEAAPASGRNNARPNIPRDKLDFPRYKIAMTQLRATYSYWYFSYGSRWQPEGRV